MRTVLAVFLFSGKENKKYFQKAGKSCSTFPFSNVLRVEAKLDRFIEKKEIVEDAEKEGESDGLSNGVLSLLQE